MRLSINQTSNPIPVGYNFFQLPLQSRIKNRYNNDMESNMFSNTESSGQLPTANDENISPSSYSNQPMRKLSHGQYISTGESSSGHVWLQTTCFLYLNMISFYINYIFGLFSQVHLQGIWIWEPVIKFEYCHALFWYPERLKSSPANERPGYNRCCKTGHVRNHLQGILLALLKTPLETTTSWTTFVHINQMFVMTSFGVKVDELINNGSGPYVFKVIRARITLNDNYKQLPFVLERKQFPVRLC